VSSKGSDQEIEVVAARALFAVTAEKSLLLLLQESYILYDHAED